MGGWVLRQHRRRCSVMKHVYSTTRVTIRSHKYLTIHVAESMESLTNNGPVDHKQPAPMTYQTLFQYNDNRGIPTRDAWRGCRTSQHHRTKEQMKANYRYKMCTRATIVSCLRVQLFCLYTGSLVPRFLMLCAAHRSIIRNYPGQLYLFTTHSPPTQHRC
jgi:hypothetical protein